MFCAPEIDPSGLDAVSISVDYIAIYSYSYVCHFILDILNFMEPTLTVLSSHNYRSKWCGFQQDLIKH